MSRLIVTRVLRGFRRALRRNTLSAASDDLGESGLADRFTFVYAQLRFREGWRHQRGSHTVPFEYGQPILKLHSMSLGATRPNVGSTAISTPSPPGDPRDSLKGHSLDG